MADVRGATGVPLAAAFAGANTPTPSTPIYLNLNNGDAYCLLGSTVTKIASAGASVSSVDVSSPTGVLASSGGPITSSGTIALAWSGTSGGVPYFSGASSMASSALLAQYGVIVGGGVGATPATVAAGTNNQFLAGNTGANPGFRQAVLASADFANQGTATTILHGNAAGNPTFGAVVLTTDVSGVLPIANGGTGNTAGNANWGA